MSERRETERKKQNYTKIINDNNVVEKKNNYNIYEMKNVIINSKII